MVYYGIHWCSTCFTVYTSFHCFRWDPPTVFVIFFPMCLTWTVSNYAWSKWHKFHRLFQRCRDRSYICSCPWVTLQGTNPYPSLGKSSTQKCQRGCNSFRECKNLVGIHFAHVWIMFFSHLPMSLHKFSWRQLKHVFGNIPILGIVIQFDDNIVGAHGHAVPPDFSGHNWGEVFWRPGPACCRCINLGRGWSCWFEWDD